MALCNAGILQLLPQARHVIYWHTLQGRSQQSQGLQHTWFSSAKMRN